MQNIQWKFSIYSLETVAVTGRILTLHNCDTHCAVGIKVHSQSTLVSVSVFPLFFKVRGIYHIQHVWCLNPDTTDSTCPFSCVLWGYKWLRMSCQQPLGVCLNDSASHQPSRMCRCPVIDDGSATDGLTKFPILPQGNCSFLHKSISFLATRCRA